MSSIRTILLTLRLHMSASFVFHLDEERFVYTLFVVSYHLDLVILDPGALCATPLIGCGLLQPHPFFQRPIYDSLGNQQ